MPTKHRVISRITKLAARPDPPLARLQSRTPTPIRAQREYRSDKRPNNGAAIMYITMKPVLNRPSKAIFGSKPNVFSNQLRNEATPEFPERKLGSSLMNGRVDART